MKTRNIIYVILMFVFLVLAYLFFDRGLNAKTRLYVMYNEESDITYKVYLHDNEIYDDEYLDMDEKYITNLVDNILIDVAYKSEFDHTMSGFYTYSATAALVGYMDDMDDEVFRKNNELSKKTVPLNQNNLKEIMVNDEIRIDYDKYLVELEKYNKDYKMNAKGYLEVKILIHENLDFFGNSKITLDDKIMTLNIPLSEEAFKIDVTGLDNNKEQYYDFSKREKINLIFLLIGIFFLVVGITFLVITIRNIINESHSEAKYRRELRKILNNHKDILVKVDEFHTAYEYNMVYVSSFEELMDAYRRVKSPISYREVKKNEETIFLMIDDDSAWIYPLTTKDK